MVVLVVQPHEVVVVVVVVFALANAEGAPTLCKTRLAETMPPPMTQAARPAAAIRAETVRTGPTVSPSVWGSCPGATTASPNLCCPRPPAVLPGCEQTFVPGTEFMTQGDLRSRPAAEASTACSARTTLRLIHGHSAFATYLMAKEPVLDRGPGH